MGNGSTDNSGELIFSPGAPKDSRSQSQSNGSDNNSLKHASQEIMAQHRSNSISAVHSSKIDRASSESFPMMKKANSDSDFVEKHSKKTLKKERGSKSPKIKLKSHSNSTTSSPTRSPSSTRSLSASFSPEFSPKTAKKLSTLKTLLKGKKEVLELASQITIRVTIQSDEVMAVTCEPNSTCTEVISLVLERKKDETIDDDPNLYHIVALIHEEDGKVIERRLDKDSCPLALWSDWKREGHSFNMLELREKDEDEDDVFMKKLDSVGGTFERLVRRLIEVGVTDPEYFKAFLLTFRHVEKPTTLMQKLLEVSVKKEGQEQLGIPELLRTINFILKWIEASNFDFENNEEMTTLMSQFQENIKNAGFEPYALKITKKLETVANLSKVQSDPFDWNSIVEKNEYEEPTDSRFAHLSILDLPVSLLAQKYTILEASLFQKIRTHEFTSALWHYETNYSIKYLELLTSFTNNTSHWVATEIILGDFKKQAQILEKFLSLAKELLKLRNFNSFCAIVAGLGSISKHKAMQNLSYTASNAWRQFQSIVSTDKNYSNYRNIFEKAKVDGLPAIPSLFVLQNDLFRTSEGMAKYLPNGVIHFRKLSKIYGIIRNIEVFQERNYTLQVEQDEKVDWYINNLPALPAWAIRQYLIHEEPKTNGSLLDRWNVVDAWDEYFNREYKPVVG